MLTTGFDRAPGLVSRKSMFGCMDACMQSSPAFLRPACLDIDDFPLKAVAFVQKLFPATPPIQRPPAQPVSKRHGRQLGAAARGMLKVIPLMAVAIREEPPVEMIVYSSRSVAGGHQFPQSIALKCCASVTGAEQVWR